MTPCSWRLSADLASDTTSKIRLKLGLWSVDTVVATYIDRVDITLHVNLTKKSVEFFKAV